MNVHSDCRHFTADYTEEIIQYKIRNKDTIKVKEVTIKWNSKSSFENHPQPKRPVSLRLYKTGHSSAKRSKQLRKGLNFIGKKLFNETSYQRREKKNCSKCFSFNRFLKSSQTSDDTTLSSENLLKKKVTIACEHILLPQSLSHYLLSNTINAFMNHHLFTLSICW